ncbi:MAG: hypothetical protein Q9162_007331 [Coniocarpon cinnabarinum]
MASATADAGANTPAAGASTITKTSQSNEQNTGQNDEQNRNSFGTDTHMSDLYANDNEEAADLRNAIHLAREGAKNARDHQTQIPEETLCRYGAYLQRMLKWWEEGRVPESDAQFIDGENSERVTRYGKDMDGVTFPVHAFSTYVTGVMPLISEESKPSASDNRDRLLKIILGSVTPVTAAQQIGYCTKDFIPESRRKELAGIAKHGLDSTALDEKDHADCKELVELLEKPGRVTDSQRAKIPDPSSIFPAIQPPLPSTSDKSSNVGQDGDNGQTSAEGVSPSPKAALGAIGTQGSSTNAGDISTGSAPEGGNVQAPVAKGLPRSQQPQAVTARAEALIRHQ